MLLLDLNGLYQLLWAACHCNKTKPVFTHAEVQLRVTKSHWTNEWPTYDTRKYKWMKWYRINIYIRSRQVNTIKNAEDDFCFELRQKCHRDWHIRLNWLSRRLLGDWGNNFNKLGHFRSLSPNWCKVQNGAAYWRRRNYPNSACSIINIRPTSK